jgi:hypothetical protein
MLKIYIVSAFALFVGACGPDPTVYVAADDPLRANTRQGYQSVTSGVSAFQVTGPRDWIQSNQAVGPQGSAGQGTAAGARRGR